MFLKLKMIMLLWVGSLVADAYSLGQYAQGGVIFFLTPDMGHGLVVAITDQDNGNGAAWGPDTIFIDSCIDGIFFGEDYATTAGSLNTDQMILINGMDAEAATLCKNYSVSMNGDAYNDWFLPTVSELRIMLKRKNMINSTAIANGGVAFEPTNYWSSLENINSSVSAIAISFNPELLGLVTEDKTALLKVRAIRAF